MASIKEVCRDRAGNASKTLLYTNGLRHANGDKTRNRWPIWVVVSAAMLLPQLIGCWGADANNPKVVPASGVVTYRGKPIEGADVTFNNEEARITGVGKTDSEGRFVLSTFGNGDGVVPGGQIVAIRRVDVIDTTPPGADEWLSMHEPEIRWVIPEEYSNPAKSGLTADVSESGPNEFRFDLK